MTSTVLKHELRQARKHYKCDATQWFHDCGMGRNDLTAEQLLMLEAAEANGIVVDLRSGGADGVAH